MFLFKILKGICSRLKIFSQNEKGATLIIFAFALIPLIGFLGLSIDVRRVYYINSVLAGAVDSAAIAGGVQADAIAQATAVFNANIPSNFNGTISGPNVTFVSNDTVIKVTATAETDTYFLLFFGIPTLTTSQSAAVKISSTGAEVVLALDNTGSMAGSPIQGEIAAAKALVNILYGGNGTTGGVDVVKGLFVGVVPYSTTVNIGTNNTSWLTTLGNTQRLTATLYPTTIPATATNVGSKWMGCIEVRAPRPTLTTAQITSFGYTPYAPGLDALDTPPTSDATKFTPYL